MAVCTMTSHPTSERFDESIQLDDPNPGGNWAPSERQLREWALIIKALGPPGDQRKPSCPYGLAPDGLSKQKSKLGKMDKQPETPNEGLPSHASRETIPVPVSGRVSR